MNRAIVGMLLFAIACPAAAAQVAECRAIGGHDATHRISAARYVKLYGSNMVLVGSSGRRDMPRWSLRCGSISKGIYCAGRSRKSIVEVWTDGWKMTERMSSRRHGGETLHVVYNCNTELVLP